MDFFFYLAIFIKPSYTLKCQQCDGCNEQNQGKLVDCPNRQGDEAKCLVGLF